MEATMTLQIEELAAKISEDLSLTRIEFDLRAGEVAAIIGPNGAGKTSLLRAICNDLGHQAGVVRFNGKDMNTWSLAERAELLAILPQRSSLEFPFTVKEVVALGRIPHSSSQRQNDAIVSEALALVTAINSLTDSISICPGARSNECNWLASRRRSGKSRSTIAV